MNPLKKIKNYFIGEALAETNDVFQKARIELMFGYSIFLLVMGLTFTGSVVANHKTWEIYLTTCFGVPSIASLLFILKKTKSVTYAGYMFVFMQVVMHLANGYLNKYEPRIDGVLWSITSIILVFFVLGKKWGLGLTIFIVLQYSLGAINNVSGNKIFDYAIPPEQILEESYFGTFIPFILVIYGLIQIVNTRTEAEKHIQEQKILLEKNNSELELKRRDVVSSINYAKRIQYAVLPREDSIYRSIPLSFILYKPKDIVSGDFFWFHEIDRDNYIIVCADCTGHGVPGAFMTVIGTNLLNQIVIENKTHQPKQILFVLDQFINVTLKQQKEHEYYVNDGMDLALLKVDKKNQEFIFSSSKRPAVFIRDKQIQEFKGSKSTLGGMITDCKTFAEIKMKYQEDDIIYFYTDGYTDQFGGPNGKKFSSKRLKEKLLSIHRLQMNEQKKQLENTLEEWKGNLEQVDDIQVMGIRF